LVAGRFGMFLPYAKSAYFMLRWTLSSNALIRISESEALYCVLPIILTRLHNSQGQQTLSPSSWRQEYMSIYSLNPTNLRVRGEGPTENRDCDNVTVYLYISLVL
jgi:hypothetical protein